MVSTNKCPQWCAFLVNSADNSYSTFSPSTPFSNYSTYSPFSNPRGIALYFSRTLVSCQPACLYVTNYGNNTVSVIRTYNLKKAITVIANIRVGKGPDGIASPIINGNPSGNLYVANYGNNTVSMINATTNMVVGTVSVGSNPSEIAYARPLIGVCGTGCMYVTNSGSNSVSVIRIKDNSVVATIQVGKVPSGIAYDSFDKAVYVANYGDGTVSVISALNNKVIYDIPARSGPYGVAYASIQRYIYVANSGNDSITMINTANQSPSHVSVKCTNAKVGATTTCTATVNGRMVVGNLIAGVPGGNVTWSQVGGKGSALFSQSSCQLTPIESEAASRCTVTLDAGQTAGTANILAVYGGNQNYIGNVGSGGLVIVQART